MEALTLDPDIDPTNVQVEVQNGDVTLKGTVSDYASKRQAEDIAESCSGVREVQNQLRVKREDERDRDDKRHRQQMAS
jgi:osmotically-inducible protein OsmY